MAETARFNARSYFGLPAKLNDYETDPTKLGDVKTLGGALGGLAKAGVNGLVNAGVRTYNAVAATGTPTTTFEGRQAAFPAANLRRYEARGAAPVQAAQTPALGLRPSMIAAHTPGERLTAPVAPAPQAAAPSYRRPQAAAVPQRPVPISTPTVSYSAEEPVAESAGRGYIEQGGVRMYIAGSKAYDGLGSTGEAQFDSAPAYRKRAGDVGYTGSQEAWEDAQAATPDGEPFFFKRRALALEQQKQAETEANNLRTYRVSQQNADTTEAGTVSQIAERDTLLPGKVLDQGSDLQTAASYRNSLRAAAAKTDLEAQFYPEMTRADIAYKNALGEGVRSKSDADLTLEKQRMIEEGKLKALEARNNSPMVKADAAYAESLAASAGLLPSEAAQAVRGGYRKVQKAKNKWFGPDQQAGLVNDAGQLFDPAAAAIPAGFKASGKFTPEGKAILVDAQGKKFVQ